MMRGERNIKAAKSNFIKYKDLISCHKDTAKVFISLEPGSSTFCQKQPSNLLITSQLQASTDPVFETYCSFRNTGQERSQQINKKSSINR
jgi:hypothetical protein